MTDVPNSRRLPASDEDLQQAAAPEHEALFDAWIRTHEDEVGALDDASARAGFTGAIATLQAMGMLPSTNALTQKGGWVSVPRQADDAQVAAGINALFNTPGEKAWETVIENIYAAMVAAQTLPPSPAAEREVGA